MLARPSEVRKVITDVEHLEKHFDRFARVNNQLCRELGVLTEAELDRYVKEHLDQWAVRGLGFSRMCELSSVPSQSLRRWSFCCSALHVLDRWASCGKLRTGTEECS